MGTLGVKALVLHTKLEKHWLASKSVQQSHAVTHFCMPLSPVPSPSCPVLLNVTSALPLPSHSQVTFKPIYIHTFLTLSVDVEGWTAVL